MSDYRIGCDDPQTAADVERAWDGERRRSSSEDRWFRRGERVGATLGLALALAVSLALWILVVAVAHEWWRLAVWSWGWS